MGVTSLTSSEILCQTLAGISNPNTVIQSLKSAKSTEYREITYLVGSPAGFFPRFCPKTKCMATEHTDPTWNMSSLPPRDEGSHTRGYPIVNTGFLPGFLSSLNLCLLELFAFLCPTIPDATSGPRAWQPQRGSGSWVNTAERTGPFSISYQETQKLQRPTVQQGHNCVIARPAPPKHQESTA